MRLRRVCVLAVSMLAIATQGAIALPKQWQASPPLLSQKSPGKDSGMLPGMGGDGRMLQQLNLSQEQMQKIQQIRDRYKNQIEQRANAVRQAQQELGSMMAGTATASQIREKHRQLGQLRQQLADLRFESMLEMREILSATQRRQLAQMMQQRRENSRKRSGNGSPMPSAGDAPF